MRESLYDYCIANGKEALLEQWDTEKNGELTPHDVTSFNNRKVWWKCEKGHEWSAIIQHRVKGTGCPVCTNRVIKVGENDLATTHPHLVAEWDYEKNGSLTPQQVRYGSGKYVWWRCEKGHEWEARVSNRARGQGCPGCNRKGVPGENSFASVSPEIATQWHPTKNGDLRPQDVTPRSARKVWWVCEKGHEWQATVKNRALGGGCPYCANRAINPGENDFATAFPEIAAQWHPTKNGDLRPQDVAPYTRRKVWWVCEKGHEWQAVVQGRVSYKSGCPVCTGRKVVPGENDFASAFPELAAQWHPTKNGDLRACDVTRFSNRKVWWLCAEGHEWCAYVFGRARGSGCPMCAQLGRKKKV